MFACIVAGRAAQEGLQVAPDRFVFHLADALQLNHLVVFAASPFPDGIGAAVCLQPANKADQWLFLGVLSNAKPSAIFRLKGAAQTSDQSNPALGSFQQAGTDVATLGLLIQDLSSLEASASTSVVLRSAQAQSAPANPTQLANLVARNLFNYLSSFAQRSTDQSGKVIGNFVDISLMENWLRTFEQKTKSTGGTSWLENQND